MTRINVVPPAELCDQHLLAEYRELTRIPNRVAKGPVSLEGQPANYVLGTGHVRFFYDKLKFLRRRHLDLAAELRARGFKAESRWPEQMAYDPAQWKDYVPTEHALRINRERIEESKARMVRKPTWAPRKQNIVFLSGSADPIPGLENADRRYFVAGAAA